MSTSYLPVVGNMSAVLENLRAARQEVGSGSGSGDTFLKIDDKTGALTFGQESNPVPAGMRWAVALQSFQHGYIDMQDGKPKERNVIPMMQGARPMPKGGSTTREIDPQTKQLSGKVRTLAPGEYGTYEGGGPRDTTEIVLTSLDEPGFNLTFTSWGKSSANRVGTLLEKAIVHCESPDGDAGFIHPVILVKSSKYHNKTFRRDVHHFDFDLIDWLHADGKTLLSQHGGAIADQSADEDGPAPWEDEGLTDEERELLNA